MTGDSRTRRPSLESLEARLPLSAGPATDPLAARLMPSPARGTLAASGADGDAPVLRQAAASRMAAIAARRGQPAPADDPATASASLAKPSSGYLVYRITNPNPFNDRITRPVNHVRTQVRDPVPGQVYNVLYVVVRNGTARSFDASDGLQVRFPGSSQAFPILTEDQKWDPGRWIVFYVLSKEYYPAPNTVSSGFEFNLGGASSVAIPGPSGIFLRLKYNPATINRVLDAIVTRSPGVPGGPKGIRLGLPDTAIYEFLSARTDRPDFGGYF